MTSVDPKKRYAVPGQETLGSPSFLGLLLTQWLTIINDNTFRWLVVGIGKEYVSPDKHNLILTLGLALFVLPYLTLASPAGYLADRFSKRQVIVICKLAEIVVMALGVWAIYLGSLPFLFLVVAMMGAQSALFAPSKMGQLPEMLPPHRISAANGWFALATFTATIIGMWIGGGLADVTRPRGQDQLWVSAAVLIGVAVLGTFCSFLIQAYQPANPTRRIPLKPHVESWRDLKLLVGNRALLLVMLGIVFFWSIGAISQLNIDQFAYESGTFFESERTPLLMSMVFGVGLGSVLAGSLSRGRIELGMLAYALLFQAFFAALLATLSEPFFNIGQPWNTSLFLAMLFLMLMGASAGLFNVPLASYLQHRSPPEQRGSILSATNLCVFAGIFLSAGIYLLLRQPSTQGDPQDALGPFRSALSSTELNESKQVAVFFKDAWDQSADQPPRLQDFVEIAPTQLRQNVPTPFRLHTLGLLVWEDLERRRGRGENPAPLAYYQEFRNPLERQVIKTVFLQSGRLPFLSSHQVFLFVGCVTLPVAIVTFLLLPQLTLRFPLVLAFQARGRIQVHDSSAWKDGQPALLVANACSSWARFVLHLTSPRRVIEIKCEVPPRSRWERGWSDFWGAVWINDPDETQGSISDKLRSHWHQGSAVVLFDPARCDEKMNLWRTWIEPLGSGSCIQVIPVFLEEESDPVIACSGIWSRLFSVKKSRVAVHFGESCEVEVQDHTSFRAWVQELGDRAVNQNPTDTSRFPASRFIQSCKVNGAATRAADSTGMELSSSDLLMRSLIARRILRKHYLADDEQYVAVLLPPSVPAAVTNLALALDSRVSVNLNYTVSEEILNACIELCGIKHVITSRKVMDKLKFKLNAEIICLEDFRDQVGMLDKLAGFWQAKMTSAAGLISKLGLDQLKPDDPLTVIFTSGSTGVPKGVVLTQENISSNVQAIEEVVRLTPDDVLIGVLPFFHSFGYTACFWGAMNLGVCGVYHFNPLDAKQVGKLCEKYGGTCLLATPTFLRTYLRRCTPEQFKKLDIVVTGAEKLPQEVADEFEAKFGVRPAEGYGTTELSPLVSLNVPQSRQPDDGQIHAKAGTVGKPADRIQVKVLDLDTGAELGPNESGMLWVSGPNVMKGYLHREDLTSEVLRDGWYKTGDVAMVDDDGFIHITGRVSRFSKIGGEMVPHVQVEDTLNGLLKDQVEDDETYKLVVTSVPDPKKGERLVVLHVELPVDVETLRKGLQAEGLPPIYVPSADSFFLVDEIPLLGTGKMDLKGMQNKAKELAG
jgi:acyl-[acyl-carrier-protein]-phospholipid O-acyltransferase/long-chain-fatty-acid--[acyl-carrier-protein] ligase